MSTATSNTTFEMMKNADLSRKPSNFDKLMGLGSGQYNIVTIYKQSARNDRAITLAELEETTRDNLSFISTSNMNCGRYTQVKAATSSALEYDFEKLENGLGMFVVKSSANASNAQMEVDGALVELHQKVLVKEENNLKRNGIYELMLRNGKLVLMSLRHIYDSVSNTFIVLDGEKNGGHIYIQTNELEKIDDDLQYSDVIIGFKPMVLQDGEKIEALIQTYEIYNETEEGVYKFDEFSEWSNNQFKLIKNKGKQTLKIDLTDSNLYVYDYMYDLKSSVIYVPSNSQIVMVKASASLEVRVLGATIDVVVDSTEN